MQKYVVAPLSLCVLRRLFHLGDFRFHGFYQLCELFFAFLSCLGVHVPRDAFAVDSRCEPSLVEVVVYHGDASRATLAYLALVGLKFLLWRGFRGGGFIAFGKLACQAKSVGITERSEVTLSLRPYRVFITDVRNTRYFFVLVFKYFVSRVICSFFIPHIAFVIASILPFYMLRESFRHIF